MPLIKKVPKIDGAVEQIKETSMKPVERTKPVDYNRIISTGSTLLDLAISGGRRRGGGIPAGIIVEVFGPEATGKTAILAEIASHAQRKGGKVRFADPEARLDKEYCQIYGLHLEDKEEEYYRPDTVREVFDSIWGWETDPSVVSLFGADSIAALSTNLEMDDEDKMGMRRAKEFSEGLRKTCRKISSNDKLVVLTNQIRDTTNTMGEKEQSTGGHAIRFYSSLRLKTSFEFPSRYIKRKATVGGVAIEKTIGINTTVKVVKSTVDDPYREAPVRIVFGYGIDNIRANLEYIKKMQGLTKYLAVDKEFQAIDLAIKHIEENDSKYQEDLTNMVIDHWEEIENKLKTERKPKVRI